MIRAVSFGTPPVLESRLLMETSGELGGIAEVFVHALGLFGFLRVTEGKVTLWTCMIRQQVT